MNFSIIPLTAILAFAFVVPSYAVSPEEVERQLNDCYRKGGECIEGLESTALALSQGRVKRNGSVLMIQTKGKSVSFTDSPSKDSEVFRYQYLGLLDGIGYHLIDKRFYEGNCFVLVSNVSGEEFVMSDIPHASPSKKRVVSVSASESYNPNEIVVWAITPERMVQEFQYSPEEYALYRLVSWGDDSTIQLENFKYSDKKICPNSYFMTVSERLQKTGGKWQLSVMRPLNVKCN